MDEFNRVLGHLRWQFGCERVLQFAIHGALASGIALVALGSANWLTGTVVPLTWAAGVPFVGALAVALARWPSTRATALVADRRFGLDERLATAVDLRQRRQPGRFDALQIGDAVAHASRAPRGWLALGARARDEALLTLGVAALGIASLLWLPLLPHPVSPFAGAAAEAGVAAADLSERALPEQELAVVPSGAAQPALATATDKDLARRVQQEQAERDALDALGHALGSVSAGQPAADAIQQGNFGAARDQLQSLGDEADQLSDAAKQQLARALQQAASATASADRQLADTERQAAQALGRTSYGEQRRALKALADQLARSGARSVPADQLQRDVGRLQQQSASSNSQSSGLSSSSAAGQPATTGSGVGSGSDQNTSGDASRLDSAGQQVQVPSRLGSGPGVRPADGTEDQTGASPALGNRSVSELSRAQQTGQVAPEANVVPSERRPVIRGYFR